MTRTKMIAALFGATALLSGPAISEPVEDTLNLNGEIELVTWTDAPEAVEGVLPEVISGWHFRGTETRAMQSDDFDNPGMIFVEKARESWETVEGAAGKSCASCHGDADESMKGNMSEQRKHHKFRFVRQPPPSEYVQTSAVRVIPQSFFIIFHEI